MATPKYDTMSKVPRYRTFNGQQYRRYVEHYSKQSAQSQAKHMRNMTPIPYKVRIVKVRTRYSRRQPFKDHWILYTR